MQTNFHKQGKHDKSCPTHYLHFTFSNLFCASSHIVYSRPYAATVGIMPAIHYALVMLIFPFFSYRYISIFWRLISIPYRYFFLFKWILRPLQNTYFYVSSIVGQCCQIFFTKIRFYYKKKSVHILLDLLPRGGLKWILSGLSCFWNFYRPMTYIQGRS